MSVRGRYAPSPTGDLHLGNASTALLAWWSARAEGGRFVMRVEDLDGPRVRPGAEAAILDDLRWLGLDWDEGPDVGGAHGPYRQSERAGDYRAAFDRLRRDGRVYPCFCSRKDIAAAASAPQEPGDEVRYPGTCRGLAGTEVGSRIDRGDPHAWRFRVDADHDPPFADAVHGDRGGPGTAPPGDFVVLRRDGTAAYQLAVVVDDAAMGIDEVVRGDDLLASTGKQILLFGALGHPVPRFAHVPLLLGEDGVRLSKRHRGTAIREVREAGWSPERTVGTLAALVGLGDGTPVAAHRLVDGFRWSRVAPRPEGVRVAGVGAPG